VAVLNFIEKGTEQTQLGRALKQGIAE